MNQGDLAMEKNDVNSAMAHYGNALSMDPENTEMKFWYAIALANHGNIEASLPLFRSVFQTGENWRELTQRLIPVGFLQMDQQTLKEILDLK